MKVRLHYLLTPYMHVVITFFPALFVEETILFQLSILVFLVKY